MRIAVCDNEPIVLEYIYKIIKAEFQQQYSSSFIIKKYDDANDLLNEHNKQFFHIVFLDIEMPKIGGFSVSDCLRSTNQNIKIVFVSGYAELQQEASDHHPQCIILKTNLEERIAPTVKALLDEIIIERAVYHFTYYKQPYSIPYDNILYVKKVPSRNQVHIVTQEHVYTQKTTIKEIAPDFYPHGFILISSSCMVNIEYIVWFEKGCITMADRKDLTVSRANSNAVNQAYEKRLKHGF